MTIDESRRAHPYSDVERDLAERIELAPALLAPFELLMHRHCLDCGLPIVRYTPTGTVYDLGIAREHVCPVDPGQDTRCLCGVPVRTYLTGVITDAASEQPHECEWTVRLGSLLRQTFMHAFDREGVEPLPPPPAPDGESGTPPVALAPLHRRQAVEIPD